MRAYSSDRQPLTAWVWGLAAVKIAIHLWNDPAYGYFRDELYYIACSEHLAWGYVDHPPLSIAVLWLTRALLGDSMLAIRIPVVVSGALTVVLTGMLTRDLGGGRFAQALAALAFLVMPVTIVMSTFFSMNAFDLLCWVAAACVLVRQINRGSTGGWIAFGLIVGLGMLNKISVGFFVVGTVVGLALTAERRLLVTPWFWIAGSIATLLFLPHVLWQIAYGFPTLEFMRNATALKIAHMPPREFLGAQILYTNPATVPIWIAGLAALLFGRSLRSFRFLGLAYVIILILLLAQHGKPYYLAPAYPMLLAAGSVAWERMSASGGWRWLRPPVVALVVVLGLVTLPVTVMWLGPSEFVRYAAAIGIEAPQEERSQRVELPQPFADRFGWENLVATVARVYHSLPADERAGVAIFTNNYGEAGAIDFFGPPHGLPPAASGHNNYWLWGPGSATGDVAITVGVPRDRLEAIFEEVTQADLIVSPFAVAFETNLPVYVCRHLKRPLRELWPELKAFI